MKLEKKLISWRFLDKDEIVLWFLIKQGFEWNIQNYKQFKPKSGKL